VGVCSYSIIIIVDNAVFTQFIAAFDWPLKRRLCEKTRNQMFGLILAASLVKEDALPCLKVSIPAKRHFHRIVGF
jgi:hypothetical protein